MARITPLNIGLIVAFGIVGAIGIGVTVMTFSTARVTSASLGCVNNLRMIDGCKQTWALNMSKTNNELPSWEDLRAYLPDRWTNAKPTCPAGGVYVIGRLDETPRCSLGGPDHTLP